MKVAIGTSLLVIAANCAAGFAGYVGQHVPIAWVPVAEFTAIAAVGIFAGVHLCDYVSPARLRRGFAILLLGVGIAVLAQGGRKLKAATPDPSSATVARHHRPQGHPARFGDPTRFDRRVDPSRHGDHRAHA